MLYSLTILVCVAASDCTPPVVTYTPEDRFRYYESLHACQAAGMIGASQQLRLGTGYEVRLRCTLVTHDDGRTG